MDYKAIEVALTKCLEREDLCHDVDAPTHDEMVSTMALWTDAAEELAMRHGMDLLRLVRAMAFIEANEPELFRSSLTSKWICDGETGDTMLDAIEAAMADTGTEPKQPRATKGTR